MKLALATFQLTRLGGKERDCLTIGRDLTRRGHEVTIFTTEVGPGVGNDVRIERVAVAGLTNHGRMRALARAFERIGRSERHDLLFSFDRLPGAHLHYAADDCFAARRLGARRLLPRYRTYLALERGVFEPASRSHVFYLNERQRAAYWASYGAAPDRSTVLPPVLHGERYREAEAVADRRQVRGELGVPPDALVAISVAVQPMQKGLDRTLAALQAIPDLHLIAVGSSDPALERQVKSLGLAGRVRILPYSDRVISLLGSADIMVHPARAEAGGQVILESLLAGTPAVVSGACGYASEVQRSGAGIVLAEPFRQADLVEAIRALAGDLESFGARARRHAAEMKTQSSRWLDVIADRVERTRAT